MPSFSDHLAQLPITDHIQQIALFLPDGSPAGVIENKPGSQGSIRVYHYLLQQHGQIDGPAARAGLKLYAEHTQDAELNPGKHPNIDRLLEVLSSEIVLTAQIT